MKCYTIKSGKEYVADEAQIISNSYWNGINIKVVDCDDEAKHYKTINTPTAWLKRTLPKLEHDLEDCKRKLKLEKQSSNKWNVGIYTTQVNKCMHIIKWLENAKVVELDLEKPNFPSDSKITWGKWRNDHSSRMKLMKDTTNLYYCKSCSIKLKNIPYYFIDDGRSRVCIPCLYLRVESIKSAFEGMDKDHRESIINELVLGSL